MTDKEYWNQEMETLPSDRLREFQKERLQKAIEWAYTRTTFYRNLFERAGVKPEDISAPEDLSRLPFTSDIEVATDIPLKDRLAVPEGEIKMFHSTSGTVGAVVPIPFTKRDEELFMREGECRARWTMGVRPWDVVQVLTRFDCCSLGYKELGASLVLLSAGRYNTDHQIHLTKEAGVTVIEHMPSLLLDYFERMEQTGINIKDTKLRMVSGVGEGWAESYKKKIENKYGVPFLTLYGAVETAPFFASECSVRDGLHINADLGILEVIDPDTEKPLPSGEEGELVVTLFQREAMPLIRYRVGDVGSLYPPGACACGRTMPRISYVKGRVSQILRISGKRILPIDVEEVIAKNEELESEFRILVKEGKMAVLELRVEHKPEARKLSALKDRVEEALFQDLGINSEVGLVPRGTLERVTFKAQRIQKVS
jgi:phenylacetate-CoA ligase